MKNDISNKDDIKLFVHEFYQKLLDDPKISHFFEGVLQENKLNEHLETIVNFWQDILFLTTTYSKNAMTPHQELHKKIPFKEIHFKRWLYHFNTTIDSYFDGEKTRLAKNRALSIATIMQIKLKD